MKPTEAPDYIDRSPGFVWIESVGRSRVARPHGHPIAGTGTANAPQRDSQSIKPRTCTRDHAGHCTCSSLTHRSAEPNKSCSRTAHTGTAIATREWRLSP